MLGDLRIGEPIKITQPEYGSVEWRQFINFRFYLLQDAGVDEAVPEKDLVLLVGQVTELFSERLLAGLLADAVHAFVAGYNTQVTEHMAQVFKIPFTMPEIYKGFGSDIPGLVRIQHFFGIEENSAVVKLINAGKGMLVPLVESMHQFMGRGQVV